MLSLHDALPILPRMFSTSTETVGAGRRRACSTRASCARNSKAKVCNSGLPASVASIARRKVNGDSSAATTAVLKLVIATRHTLKAPACNHLMEFSRVDAPGARRRFCIPPEHHGGLATAGRGLRSGGEQRRELGPQRGQADG